MREYLLEAKLINYCVVLILIFFSLGVMVRNGDWKDEVTLWSDAKMKSPNLVRPYNNVGEAYDKLGQYDEAIAEFEGALKLNPNYFFGLNNLGNIYGKQRKLPEAIDYFKRALSVDRYCTLAQISKETAQNLLNSSSTKFKKL